MNKLLITLFLFSLSFTSYSDEFDGEDEDKPLKMIISTIELQPSILSVKKALIRVIIQNNWKIQYQDRTTITAQYNKSPTLKASITRDSIILEEIKMPGAYFKESWMLSIKSHVIKDLNYFHHIEKAKLLLK